MCFKINVNYMEHTWLNLENGTFASVTFSD